MGTFAMCGRRTGCNNNLLLITVVLICICDTLLFKLEFKLGIVLLETFYPSLFTWLCANRKEVYFRHICLGLICVCIQSSYAHIFSKCHIKGLKVAFRVVLFFNKWILALIVPAPPPPQILKSYPNFLLLFSARAMRALTRAAGGKVVKDVIRQATLMLRLYEGKRRLMLSAK